MEIRVTKLDKETTDILKVMAARSGKSLPVLAADIIENSLSPARQHLELLAEVRQTLYQILAEVEEIKNGLFYLEQTEGTVSARQEKVFELTGSLTDCIQAVNVSNRRIVQAIQAKEKNAAKGEDSLSAEGNTD